MSVKLTSLFVSLFLGAGAVLASSAYSQDAGHTAAAKKAMAATRATDSFDLILPNSAMQLKNRLSSNNPDKSDQIDLIVDDEALALASRRGDLENAAAKLFIDAFSIEELDKISAFFGTELGQKYLSKTPTLARELGKAARVWGTGVQRDLATNSGKKVADLLKK